MRADPWDPWGVLFTVVNDAEKRWFNAGDGQMVVDDGEIGGE